MNVGTYQLEQTDTIDQFANRGSGRAAEFARLQRHGLDFLDSLARYADIGFKPAHRVIAAAFGHHPAQTINLPEIGTEACYGLDDLHRIAIEIVD
ncbi:hypothetical protein D3C87_1603620 [compost metagenome]